MNKLKMPFILFLLIFTAQISFSQVDSSRVNQERTRTNAGNTNQNANRSEKGAGEKKAEQGTKEIKQIKGARPDMSKARGARPPDIVRPSGSGIPRGMGKPGGARRGGK